MVHLSVNEPDIKVPRWLVALIIAAIVIPSLAWSFNSLVTSQAMAAHAQETADQAVKENKEQNERITRLETVIVDTASIKADVANVKSDVSDIKKDIKNLLTNSRNAR